MYQKGNIPASRQSMDGSVLTHSGHKRENDNRISSLSTGKFVSLSSRKSSRDGMALSGRIIDSSCWWNDYVMCQGILVAAVGHKILNVRKPVVQGSSVFVSLETDRSHKIYNFGTCVW